METVTQSRPANIYLTCYLLRMVGKRRCFLAIAFNFVLEYAVRRVQVKPA
jgi:hypothetical protein